MSEHTSDPHGYWQLDFTGTRVHLDDEAYGLLRMAMIDAPRGWMERVTDLYGSPTDIMLDKIECITFKTPASVAEYQRRIRDFDKELDRLDPEGAAKKPEAWEVGSDE